MLAGYSVPVYTVKRCMPERWPRQVEQCSTGANGPGTVTYEHFEVPVSLVGPGYEKTYKKIYIDDVEYFARCSNESYLLIRGFRRQSANKHYKARSALHAD